MTTNRRAPRRWLVHAVLMLMLGLGGLAAWPQPAAAQKEGKPSGDALNGATDWPAHLHESLVGAAAWTGQFEFMQMLSAVWSGSMMGPGDGWFHPSQTRYGWVWLAYHCDKDANGKITRAEFTGPAHYFKKLDRDGNGVVTAADLDWFGKSGPAPKPGAGTSPVTSILSKIDRDGDGKISADEWQTAFKFLAATKDHLGPQDLAKMFAPPSTPPKGGGGPSKEILIKGLFSGELGSMFEGPKVGDAAPNFSLRTQDGKQTLSLEQYQGHRPVVLIFGSFT